jgi:hypothetical protein
MARRRETRERDFSVTPEKVRTRKTIQSAQIDKIDDEGIRRAYHNLDQTRREKEASQRELALSDDTNNKVFRSVPADDAQLLLFDAVAYDVPTKDEINMMDFAPFSIAKSRKAGDNTIEYQLPDAAVTVAGSDHYGLATAYDYEIVHHMVSQLAHAFANYWRDEKRGLHPELPGRRYQPFASDVLQFCRRANGGKQYEALEKAMDRLKTTSIKIVSFKNGKRRAGHFSLLEDYKIISKSKKGTIERVEMVIPQWIYDAVAVEEGKIPSILTVSRDYFRLTPLAKVIYRFGKRLAYRHSASIPLSDVAHRSGFRGSMRQFKSRVADLVNDAKTKGFPEFSLDLVETVGEPCLRMVPLNPAKEIAAPETSDK